MINNDLFIVSNVGKNKSISVNKDLYTIVFVITKGKADKILRREVVIMKYLENLACMEKLNEIVNKKEEEKTGKKVLWVLAIIGAVAAVAGIAYAVYRYFTPDYLDDFDDEDFEDEDFDDDFEDEDIEK